MNRFFILLIGLFLAHSATAQELNCAVIVNLTTNTTSINPAVFKNMERSISEFMNNRKWTDEKYELHQRVKCTLTINIVGAGKENSYKGDFTIQAERPVFNSTYTTAILRHIDKSIPFDFIENQPLDYSDQTFFSNLTSALAFYANLIIATENETFSPKGGQNGFEKCQSIANTVPANLNVSGEAATGWSAAEAQDIKGQRTRIGFILGFLTSSADPFRQAIYKYHLHGLDLLEESPEKALENIESAIFEMAKSDNGHYIYKHFVMMKVDEIMNIFKAEPTPRRKKIADILLKIEPNSSDRIPKL